MRQRHEDRDIFIYATRRRPTYLRRSCNHPKVIEAQGTRWPTGRYPTFAWAHAPSDTPADDALPADEHQSPWQGTMQYTDDAT